MNKLDGVLEIDHSHSPTIKKQLVSVLVLVTVRIIANEVLVYVSSLKMHNVECDLYFGLQTLLLYMEVFITKTYFNEASRLFSKINERVTISGSITNLDNHEKLTRIILENQQAFNTNLIFIILSIFVLLVTTFAKLVLEIGAVIKREKIDLFMFAWNVSNCIEFPVIVLVLIKMRMDVVIE
ncbi:hypothetical protein QE152_g35033, partial [Popillia japonica]